MIDALSGLTSRLKPELTRDQILQDHAWHESHQQKVTPSMPYRQLLAVVYKRLAEQWGLKVSWQDCETYGQSVYETWPAFEDSTRALAYLKDHFQLVILSNVDNQSFSGSNRRLEVTFDAIYTAEDVGSYKPNDANFQYMIDHLARRGIDKSDILHTAESMFHDHQPATRFGLARCWIYRRHDQSGYGATMDPGTQPSVDFQFNSMAAMVEAHQAEQNG